MAHPFAWPLVAMVAAFWPVWIWFANGLADKSNDYSGLLAVATVVVVLARARVRKAPAYALALPALLTALYLFAVLGHASTAIAGALAVLALATLASAIWLGQRCDLPLVALSILALPLAATLQFYLGYPLRLLAGLLTATLLKLNGMAVVREGATLVWDGQTIAIDAPCSGVRMLWTGLYLAFALAALSGMRARSAALGALAAIGIVVIANAVRAAALFYVEAGIVKLDPWAHGAIGMLCFVAAALAILAATHVIGGARR